MYINFRLFRYTVIDYRVYVGNIQTSMSYIRRDQNLALCASKLVQ